MDYSVIIKGVFVMKKLVAFVLVLVLCLSMTVTAFAADYASPEGGDSSDETVSPKTGSVAVAVLAAAACTAGGISVVSYKKSKN